MQYDAIDLKRRLQIAEAAARASGDVQKRYFGTRIEAEIKSDPQDMLTRADLEGQVAAKSIISAAFPGETVIGEEDGLALEELAPALANGCWLIDPLDGTQSFVHHFPVFGPGIAFVHERRALVGVAYLPLYEELFAAARGLGATLNGRPISVAPAKPLEDAMVALHIRDVGPEAVERFLVTTGRILPRCNGVRLLGSPMITAVYVAAGRLDCCATLSPTKLGPWDLAPAQVILEEAGGVVGGQDGEGLDLLQHGLSGASSTNLLEELFRVASGKE